MRRAQARERPLTDGETRAGKVSWHPVLNSCSASYHVVANATSAAKGRLDEVTREGRGQTRHDASYCDHADPNSAVLQAPGDFGFAAQLRSVLALSSSIGKNDSTRNSCAVMSWGVPKVAIVVNSCSDTSCLRKCMGRTALAPLSSGSLFSTSRTPLWANSRSNSSALSGAPSAAASASTLRMK